MPFKFVRTSIDGAFVVVPQTFEDSRGFFMETYSRTAFQQTGIAGGIVQENHSKSMRGVVRGLHFQKEPYAQSKLVRCTRGEIFDVGVDLRKGSSTFGKWVSTSLSESNRNMLYVPRGFAHGFQVVSDTAEVQYSVDNEYTPKYEGGLLWNDSALGIPWPIKNPILSERDKKWPTLEHLE